MKGKTLFGCLLVAACALTTVAGERRISVEEYRDKMAGGWIGQMVGVGWGAPTEFKFKGEIIPEDKVPKWKPQMVNQYNQDDIYVEMTFLRSMELYGLDVSIRQAGIDFSNSGYRLWHANKFGRENLRNGIAPPDSGHPKFNAHADDIDYQIEADFSGLIAPGMPNMGIELGEKFGRLMNYGDGLYGGQFVAGMYAAAFFEKNPKKIVEAGLACIPPGSQYAEAVRDVIQWHAESPDDWQATWKRIDAKYQLNQAYRRFSCNKSMERHAASMAFNIDAKLNGAYIVMGLLYGEGDIEKTTIISMRCGADSDCNPSSAAGVLCTAIGMNDLPAQYISALDRTPKFSHTAYNFDALLAVCETLARQAVVQQGGRIETDAFVIPVRAPRPTALEQCWAPGPISNSRFTKKEMAKIDPPPEPVKKKKGSSKKTDISKAVKTFAPGWGVRDCGSAMQPGLRKEWSGRKNVLLTHPLSQDKPCILFRNLDVPAGKKTALELTVRNDDRGDFKLVVKANSKEILSKDINANRWQDISVDLSKYAGKTIKLEVLNQATNWKFEAAYWGRIAVESKSVCVDETGSEWINLFNGKNLDGWVGNPEVWRVVDGHIEGKGPSTYKQYLSNTNHVFKNFILEARFFPVKGNSGINYRSHEYTGKNRPYETSGYQCDIGPMGALYDIYTTSNKKDAEGKLRYGLDKKKSNKLVNYKDWNTFKIVADGKKLQHYINGTLCMEFEDNDPEGFREKGFVALEHHDKGVTVWFKDIRVKELK